MTYNFKIKDYELLDCFNFTNKSFILKTKELGSLTLNSRVFNKKEKVMINERINVYVSIEITQSDCCRIASITGIVRANSSSIDTGSAPGRVDSPPISIISAPSSIIFVAWLAACSGVSNFPPSLKESGVTLRIPIIKVFDGLISQVCNCLLFIK